MFVDDPVHHKSAMIREAFEGDVVLEYFPPYTPELNPVEVQWRVIKKGMSTSPTGRQMT